MLRSIIYIAVGIVLLLLAVISFDYDKPKLGYLFGSLLCILASFPPT